MLSFFYNRVKKWNYHFLRFIISLFSNILPRNKKIWVFIGWHRSRNGEIYADNTRHFLEYIRKNNSEITPVWIAKDKQLATELQSQGIISYYEKSLRGIWCQLRAHYFIIDAFLQKYNALFSHKAKIVQLLHGKGLKKKGYAETPAQKNDHIFGTSPFTNSLLPTEFTQGSALHTTGYPRNDCLFESAKNMYRSQQEIQLIDALSKNRAEGKKIILYAPTFRRGQKTLDPNQNLSLLRVQEFSQLHKCIFLVSLHTKYRDQKKLYQEGNIIGLPECDINIIMPYIDILITDYSSSYIDYLLLDRPMIFYIYDIEEYDKNEGLIENYQSHMPGIKVRTQDEVFSEIKAIINGIDTWSDQRKKVCSLYHTHQDAKASERIFKILTASLN